MVLSVVVRLSCFFAIILAGTSVIAQEFSADVLDTKGKAGFEKVYASNDKLRLDSAQKGNSMGPGAFILDETQRKTVALMLQQRMYVEIPIGSTPTALKFWRVSDPDDACPQWKKATEQIKSENPNKWTCAKMGNDSVDGRSAVKYKGTSSDGKTSYIWVDTKLHCVTRMQDDSSDLQFRNIKEGSQPASLFEVPAGYQKFDMGSMMPKQK